MCSGTAGSNATTPYPTSAQDSDYDMSDDDSGDLTKPWLAEYQHYICQIYARRWTQNR